MIGSPLAQMPRPLTRAEAAILSQRQVKRHDIAIMLLHWFNAIVWLLELATGFALLTSAFRVAPLWYLRMMESFFHSRANILQFHIVVGITWTIVFLAYGTFGFRTYLAREILEKEISLDLDDIRWLRIRVLRILKISDEPLPLQGLYNAGQKVFALLVYAMLPIIMITGLIMTFHLIGTSAVGWAAVIHFAAVGAVFSGLMIHVYMGAVFPEEKAAFFSMLTGTVNELYAYSHHFKWWEEISQSAIGTKREHSSQAPGATPSRQKGIAGEGEKQ